MNNLKSILSSFRLKDDLNSKIWEKTNGKEYSMNPKVRNHLLEIANDFIDSLEVNVIFSDIIMTGSLANYNWSNYSDVDLHIIADFNQFPKSVRPLYDELFHLKKTVYGIKHNIKIYGYDVELYIEDESIARDVESAGRYSVLNNEWVIKPPKESINIKEKSITEKAKKWMKIIDDVEDSIQDEDIESAKKLIKKYTTKIRKFRECGLEKGGEYSEENLVFKILRRNGYLEKLKGMKDKLIDKNLSLKEQNIKDPNLTDEKKANIVKPDVEEFYKNLESIDSNVYQESPKNYTFQKDVETIQIALDILGYELPKYGVDGKFGPETAKAVNDFKRDNQIEDLSESYNDLPVINDTYNNITFDKRTTGDRLPKNLLDDIQDAAEKAGITVSVNWAKRGHGKYTRSGNISRHWKGYAVDVSTVNGQGWSSKQMAINKGIYDDIENFVALLKNKGYNVNSESKHEKAVLYFGFPYHENHLHISNMSNTPSTETEDEDSILGRLKNTFSKLFDFSDDSDKSFVSPEMTNKLIEKLKEKQITSEDLEKYTKMKNSSYPVELITGDVKIQGRFNDKQLKNIKIMIEKLNEIGIKNPYSQVGVLSVIGKETNFIPKNEGCYDTTANSRIREKFGDRVEKYSESELDELKKDCERFFDVVYGKEAGIKWNTGNTEKGDGYKYRGRGFNQITFKHNYEKIGDLIGMDLVSNPDVLNDVDVAAEAAVKFFTVNAKGQIPNFDNKEDAIKYFANINAGGGQSSSLDDALESGQRFDVVV